MEASDQGQQTKPRPDAGAALPEAAAGPASSHLPSTSDAAAAQEEAAEGLAALLAASSTAYDLEQTVFASVEEALALPLPAERQVKGARPPVANRQGHWAVQFKIRKEQGWLGGLDRQKAAVATDLVLARRRCQAEQEEPADWNIAGASYEQDGALLAHLRHIDTAADMQAFLRAVLLPGSSARTRKPKPKPSPLHGPPAPSPLQGPPAPSPLQAHQSHAGHDSSCSGEAGNEPGGEGEAPPQHGVGGAHVKCEAGGQGGDVADGEAGTQGCPAPSATAAGLDLRSWEQDAEGWWRRRLSATTCRPNNNQSRLGLHLGVFESLTGRRPEHNRDSLVVEAADGSGQRFEFQYTRRPEAGANYLQGAQLKAWVAHSGAVVGDSMALRAAGDGTALVLRIPGPGQAQQQRPQGAGHMEGTDESDQVAAWIAEAEGGVSPRGARKRKQSQWGAEWVVPQKRSPPAAALEHPSPRHVLDAAADAASPAAPAQGPRLVPHVVAPSAAFMQRAADAVQRKVQQALAAFEAADSEAPDSMLPPLRLLAIAGQGGKVLRGAVHGWAGLSLETQRDVFDAALIASSGGDWEQLEGVVGLALGSAA